MTRLQFRWILSSAFVQALAAVVLLVQLTVFGLHVTRPMEILAMVMVVVNSLTVMNLTLCARRATQARDLLVKASQMREKAWLS